MKDEDIKVGQHLWVESNEELLIVMKAFESGINHYTVCGEWEECMEFDDFKIISLIERPEGYENAPLLYVDE